MAARYLEAARGRHPCQPCAHRLLLERSPEEGLEGRHRRGGVSRQLLPEQRYEEAVVGSVSASDRYGLSRKGLGAREQLEVAALQDEVGAHFLAPCVYGR